MTVRSIFIFSLALALLTDADCVHLVEEVANFLNQKIDFVGHDKELRSHITALENDFKELDNLDNKAWEHDHVQMVLTSLTDGVTVLRRVEDHVISLARASRTEVHGLEAHLNQFKRQVDGKLSTDNTYHRIMDLVGSLIKDSVDIMRKEIVEIDKAESMMNNARAEMSTLKGLLRIHEDHQDEADTAVKTESYGQLLTSVLIGLFGGDTDTAMELGVKGLKGLVDVWDHRDKFDRVEENILDCFQYFEKEVKLIEKEEIAMRNLKNKYNVIRANWDQEYHQNELEEVAEDDGDWNIDVMAEIRSLKRNINSFVNSAGLW